MHQDIKEKSAAGAGSMDAWAQMLEDTGGDPPEKAATLVLGRENSPSLRYFICFHAIIDHVPRQARDTHEKSLQKLNAVLCRYY